MTASLSSDDEAALCDAAALAWNKLGPRGRRAHFTWRGQPYVATHTTFALVVETPAGERVSGRYDG